MRFFLVVLHIFLIIVWISCKDGGSPRLNESPVLAKPQFVIHDPSNIFGISPNVLSSYSSTYPVKSI